MERTVSTKNRARSGRHGKKHRDMLKEGMPKDKADVLCARLRSMELWQFDEDWPNDEEETRPSAKHVKG